MAIRERKVKNKRNSQGILTGRSGIVYDVNVKVYENGRQKSIAKRGFATRREAELYEAQIKLELQTGSAAMVGYGPESKQKLKEYLPKWYESYHHNLAKSTRYSYWSGISIHLIPMLGEVPLNKLTPQMIDDMIAQLREKGLAENSVRYCHRILSSALSSAVKYGYIPNNPAKNIMTRFSKNAGRKYEKYTVEQVQQLLAFVHGNVLETVVLLAVLFGLRLSEALGLRWRDVDLTHRQITLRGQIPCDLPKDAKIVPHLEPLKDRDEGETRSFPITEEALPIFLRLRQEKADHRRNPTGESCLSQSLPARSSSNSLLCRKCKRNRQQRRESPTTTMTLLCASRTVRHTYKSVFRSSLTDLCVALGCRKSDFTIYAAQRAPICTI